MRLGFQQTFALRSDETSLRRAWCIAGSYLVVTPLMFRTSYALLNWAMRWALLSVTWGLLSVAQAAELPIDVRVAQHGSFAGIRNTLHTVWLAPGQAFARLSGRVTLAGNHPGFSEALVMLGYAGQDASQCARMDGTVIPGMPSITRLWAGILKSNDTVPVGVPVEVDLSVPVSAAHPEAGVCLATLVSAGYPFLRRDLPLYTSTGVQLRVITAPPAGRVLTFGMGGEFRLPGDPAAPAQAYVGIEARRPLVLDSLAVSVSAAPVAGAPAGSAWRGEVRGRWEAGTDFTIVPAAACHAAHYASHPVGAEFSVLRSVASAAIGPPAGSLPVLHLPLAGHDMSAAQATRFYRFGGEVPGGRLAPGDCLLAFHRVTAGAGGAQIDVENQSTLYLRAPP